MVSSYSRANETNVRLDNQKTHKQEFLAAVTTLPRLASAAADGREVWFFSEAEHRLQRRK